MKEYTYAVARIRSKETELLTEQDIDRLIAARDAAEAERILGDDRRGGMAELWELLEDIEAEDITALLRLRIDYHNIKAAVKAVFSDADAAELLKDHGSADKELVYESVKKRDYSALPEELAETAEAAMSLILRTQDGQLCDMYIDKAQLAAAEDIAARSGDEFIKRYAALMADTANLRIAMRCAVMNKSLAFAEGALYGGGSLDIEELAKAAAAGRDAVIAFAEGAGFAPPAGLAAFEKYCDDRLTELCEETKYDSFSAAPILAYAHARLTELAATELIISAKRSRIDNDVIRERVRRLYE